MALRNGGIITQSEYVGKSVEEAQKYAEDGGFNTRIVEKDGTAFIVTADLKGDRLNFRVNNNIVIEVYGG